jgi:galactonate dehydratase
MKIQLVETLHCDAGWRPWTFVKITTDDGLVGWGECSDARNPFGVEGAVKDYAPRIIGRDPREVDRIYTDLFRLARYNLGGVAHHAIAGIELALWDIKGKALGVPVYELFGGPHRERVRVYWSHCGTYRAANPQLIGKDPLLSYDDVAALGKEVVARGFTALKTNAVIPGTPPRVYNPYPTIGYGNSDGTVPPGIIDAYEKLIGTFRDAVGPEVGIALDIDHHYRTEGAMRVARAMEQFDLMWLEYDSWDANSVLQVKNASTNTICSGEDLHTTRQYRPFIDIDAMHVCKIDIPWNGFSAAYKVAALAEAHEMNVAPHNYCSHLATMISAHLCATIPNVQIMEIDVDDIPWREDLTTTAPEIVDGHMLVPTAPGWGCDVVEEVLREHPIRQ